MSISSNDIESLDFRECIAIASAHLGWQTLPEETEVEDIIEMIFGPTREWLRWLLKPFCDPFPNTQPRTVYCGTTPSTSTALVAAAIMTAENIISYSTELEALQLCIAEWYGE